MSRDAIVVGAGAAGIGAARRLHEAGLDILLIEAGGRIGGRAHSVAAALPGGREVTLDLGCGWLHSARRNPWVPIARAAGFAIDHTPARWGEQWRDLGFPRDEQAAFGRAWDSFEHRVLADAGQPDRPLGADVDIGDPWRPLLDAISGYANGAPLDRVSREDWTAYEKASTQDNWALPAGYGTLIACHARGLPVRLATRATRIEHGGRALRVVTDAGTLDTAAVIVAVPTTVLADETITFDPPLPDKHHAAAQLPLGLADKIFLSVDGVDLPRNGHLIGDPHKSRTGSYRLGAFGEPVIECFLGGALAEDIGRLGDEDAAAFAIDELVALLGEDWRRRLTFLTRTRWRQAPFIGGSYSHARVGAAGQRQILAEPVGERLFFAGEACSPDDFSTCHGALESGWKAAEKLLDLHRRSR